MRIDYEKLAADYQDAQFSKLRGFGAGAGFLDTWVPDPDPIKSLCNMLDAAAIAGRKRLDIYIGPETAGRLDENKLAAAAGSFGKAGVKAENKGLLLTVRDLMECAETENVLSKEAGQSGKYVLAAIAAGKSWARDLASRPVERPIIEQAAEIGALYAGAVARTGEEISFEGGLDERKGAVLAEGAHMGAKLTLLVNADDHLISGAAHGGAATDVSRALLDRLCALIMGVPIQEASDHGMIRLEYDLRDRGMGRPVSGIVSPEAADAAFLLPLKLIRAALADYRSKTGNTQTANAYDPSPSAEWLAMSADERRQSLAAVIAEVAKEHGFSAKDVEVTDIEFGVRVVIRLKGSLEQADRQRHIMILEQGIKAKLDRRLELFLEEIKDINKIRRLSGEEAAS